MDILAKGGEAYVGWEFVVGNLLAYKGAYGATGLSKHTWGSWKYK